ncbi:helix-turn-helix transcriptional regulator [Blautia hydrogenotrophica]|uniref:helix-turn-helix domain-containing protein n=1 Tax=Blautia hydrogenotrophica TaxID=53443 RepID=UPI002943B00B|nr:helix-turn-helix transcriptional regulator [Blautia hydrogenotrophica]
MCRKEERNINECNYSDIIQNIKSIINRKGMKQKVVAERAGFTPQEFSNILNERRKLLRVEYMPAIADAMEVDVNELYGINRKE